MAGIAALLESMNARIASLESSESNASDGSLEEIDGDFQGHSQITMTPPPLSTSTLTRHSANSSSQGKALGARTRYKDTDTRRTVQYRVYYRTKKSKHLLFLYRQPDLFLLLTRDEARHCSRPRHNRLGGLGARRPRGVDLHGRDRHHRRRAEQERHVDDL